MHNNFKAALIIFLFIVGINANAQKSKVHVLTMDEAKIVKKDATTMFATEDYNGALKAYLDLYKTDQNNPEFNYRIGYCYLMTSVNKSAALKYLEFAIQSKDAKKEWYYYLGQAYMYNNKWDEAAKAFNDYKEAHLKLLKDLPTPDRMIEMCTNGKELSARPVNCTFLNMGKSVNTPFEEYNPFISADGKTLVFTSRRKGNVGGFIEDLGIYTADIYWSLWKDTIWSKSRGLGGMVNSEWDEESVSLSAAGDQVMIYFDNVDAFGDLGVASLKGKMWQKPVMMSTQINSKQYEGSACMTLDGSVIYFSSDRKEGRGGNDLWMIRKEQNGQWGNAINLGNSINTQYDEESPILSLDGKTLYFSSKGWNSMGGFDVFASQWNESENKWGVPVNIGFPLNDADDNNFISFTGDNRFAYITSSRPGGLGDKDIYKIEFPDTSHHPFTHIITGNVTATGGRIEITKVSLENKKNSAVTEFRPSGATNFFVLPAEPGEYTLKVEGYNFAPYSEEIIVDNSFPPAEINKAIQVKSGK